MIINLSICFLTAFLFIIIIFATKEMRLSFYSGLALAMIAADNAKAEQARQ